MRYILVGLLLTVQTIMAQNYGRDDIPVELLENADAVLRLDALDISLLAVDRMTYTATTVVTVLNAKGDRYANARLYYDRSKKIKKLGATIHDGSGNQIAELKRKDFKDVAAVDGFSLYVDYRLLYHDYVPVQYPYTMAFTYQVESSDTGALPSWHFVPGFGLSVENSRYSISHPPELRPRAKESNLRDFPVERQQDNGLLRYTAAGIPAVVEEHMAPAPRKYFPRLEVWLPTFHYKGHKGTVETWQDMGLWVHQELLEGRDQLGESTLHTVRALVAGVDDDLEKAKIVYRFVQDNTRYVSVQMGIGGLQPIPAMEVAHNRYGDCKGLTNYTLALLKAVGVESHYAVVEAGRAKIDLEEDFPTLAQGNHVILAIPHKGGYHWLDCTSQYLPFGYIGDFTDDRKAFVVTPEGGEIVGTTAYLDGENFQRVRASLSVAVDRSIQGEVNFRTGGALYDGRFPLERQIDKDIKEFYGHYWDNIGGLQVKEYRFENDRDQVVFTEALTLAAPNYLAKNGEAYLLVPNAFNQDLDLPQRYRDRKLPFEVQRGFEEDTQTTLAIPSGLRVAELPEKFVEETRFGSYSVETIDKGDGQLLYKRHFLLKAGEYPKEEYRDFRNFLRTVVQRDKDKIVLVQAP